MNELTKSILIIVLLSVWGILTKRKPQTQFNLKNWLISNNLQHLHQKLLTLGKPNWVNQCMYICILYLAVSISVSGCTCYINKLWIVYILVILFYSRSTSSFYVWGFQGQQLSYLNVREWVLGRASSSNQIVDIWDVWKCTSSALRGWPPVLPSAYWRKRT